MSILGVVGVLSGCAPSPSNQANRASMAAPLLTQVVQSSYQPSTDTFVVNVKKQAATGAGTNENTIDLNSSESIYNYATSQVADQPLKHVQIQQNGRVIRTYNNLQAPATDADGTTAPGGIMGSTAGFAGGASIPPGVRYNSSVHPVAGPGSSASAKEQAVLQVARSKLGTPYIWGHNEDRGQYGFDCSNYVAYVMHHALGYRMSGASMVQVRTAGLSVPVSQMRPGDIIFFENGKHEGIYVGGRRMINEGGGLGKVGYLSIGPGSYWGNRITSVRRLT